MQSDYQPQANKRFSVCLISVLMMGSALTSGCAMKSTAGPSAKAVESAAGKPLANADIQIVDINDELARRLLDHDKSALLSETVGDGQPIGTVIGKGDVLDVSIWEAPPATLFGVTVGDARVSSSSATSRATSFPEQMVDVDGRINIPFVGYVQAAGRTPQQVSREITSRLVGKAHEPQVVVRSARSASTNVTVVGDVAASARVPLTAKGERLLDALASVGGVRQALGKTVIQVTRGDRIGSVPLEKIIKDPRQNIVLQPNDIVTALFQPYSFIALGATGANAEVPYEATGITLAQALARVGGLNDQRANVRGVFIFRLEDPAVLDTALRDNARLTPDGKIPVIYRVDMKDPATFFVAQSFPVHNKDVLYVANASLAEIQKFMTLISSMVYPVVAIETMINNNN